jgi:2-polyprenyl-6-methoxyphenol hydroxylase-like FAD-dependent oxidoreductase
MQHLERAQRLKKDTPVLIVGAGPTGLNLALGLARRRVPFRIISDANGPGEHSRAMVVQARTLEFYDQFGFGDEVVNDGIVLQAAHLREATGESSHEVLSFSFRGLGEGLSPFPFALAYPQDDHERFLLRKLEQLGVAVEWGTRLVSFEQNSTGVCANVSRDDATSTVNSRYICGCDGAHSRVREAAGVGFPGGSYQQLFYVADVSIDRAFERDLYISLGEHILSLMFPVRSHGMQRLIGLVPPEMSDRTDLTFEDIRGTVEPLLDIKVKAVNWFSTYRVHHRVADHFRVARAFLLGDAGHIHSPAGGQGMNTGIGDAVNLGWKLAQVLQKRAAESILDTYEPERIGFARSLVSTTDRAFTPMVADGLKGELARRIIAPLFAGVATRFAFSRHAMFRLVSQTRIHYADSLLSEGKAGDVHGGDRLPWIPEANNFAPLRSLDWQLHVYGQASDELKTACQNRGLAIHVFDWNDQAEASGLNSSGLSSSGLKRDGAYLVRPDGHVALAIAEQSASKLEAYVDRHGLEFGSAATVSEQNAYR